MKYLFFFLLLTMVGCASLRYDWNADQKRCRDRKTGQYVMQLYCQDQMKQDKSREIIKP